LFPFFPFLFSFLPFLSFLFPAKREEFKSGRAFAGSRAARRNAADNSSTEKSSFTLDSRDFAITGGIDDRDIALPLSLSLSLSLVSP